jgi:hypothetical protein
MTDATTQDGTTTPPKGKKAPPAPKLPSTDLVRHILPESRKTMMAPSTFDEAIRFAHLLAESTMVPEAYQNNAPNILVAMQYGAELGLNPLQSVQNVAMIGARPTIWGDAMLGLVKASPLCTDIIESYEGTLADGTRTAVCTVKRVGKTDVTVRFSIEDAKLAKLWGKAGPWTNYPDRMLRWRARGFACRDQFPDLLKGIISAEEALDSRMGVSPIIDGTVYVDEELPIESGEDIADSLPDVDDALPSQADLEQTNVDPERGQLNLGGSEWFGGFPPAKTYRELIERLPQQLEACTEKGEVMQVRDRPDVLHAINNARREIKLQILDLIGAANARFYKTL